MVSTRSSTRKPPNPSRPPRATSAATSAVTQVVDDPPPPYPRRSPRIRIKNGDDRSLDFISLTPSSSTTATRPSSSNQHGSQTQHNCQTADTLLGDHHQVEGESIPKGASPQAEEKIDHVGPTAMPAVEQQVPSPADHQTGACSDDDGPEEVTAADAKRQVDESSRVERSARIAVQREVKKRRRRRRKEKTAVPLQSDVLDYDAKQQEDTDCEVAVAERLSNDAIVAAKSAIHDAKARKLAAAETAGLKKQVKHVGHLNRPQRVGTVEVAVVANAFAPVRDASKKGRRSAAYFLTSCIRNGPKRIPGSKIAMKAASARSLRT